MGNEMPDSVLHPEGRVRAWERLGSEQFDVVVIGGGVVGAGAALDAATRGLKVALVEARDFASGTSSRSSKMFHGGLRYLEQLEFGLVREALHERELSLTTLAPHLATWFAQPTGLVAHSEAIPAWVQGLAALMGAGVSLAGLRDLAVARGSKALRWPWAREARLEASPEP